MPSLIQARSGNSSAASRRSFMGRTHTLSAVAVSMLAVQDAMAAAHVSDTSKDVRILNVALGLKHEAINAYQFGASSGLLRTDVLDLAARLELGAINADLGAFPAFGSKDLAKVAARLAADETMHYTLLNNALGRPLPAGAPSFGAQCWGAPGSPAWGGWCATLRLRLPSPLSVGRRFSRRGAQAAIVWMRTESAPHCATCWVAAQARLQGIFFYSEAMAAAKPVWDRTQLRAWLTNLENVVPGQNMNCRLELPQDRNDGVAYLESMSINRSAQEMR